jgi:hypothetical protein
MAETSVKVGRVLVLHEKHGRRMLDATTDALLYEAAHAVLSGRKLGGWYTYFNSDEEQNLTEALAGGPSKACWRLLRSLSDGEYERVELVDLDTLDDVRNG